ncbi:MAG: NUDIX hydrolase [Candidatus Zixiibacteriota bacterium]|nr:MAG: NUDIX hydrolase [candidate division Zixibacteria bacterium]
MARRVITCPHCGGEIPLHDNPKPTVDIIIHHGRGVVLVRRKYPPPGWAIPGGFVDYGETVEQAAAREAKEETGLDLLNLRQFHVYSDPRRDPRGQTIGTVFTADGQGMPAAADDAADIGIFGPDDLPEEMAFDHRMILRDYFSARGELQ